MCTRRGAYVPQTRGAYVQQTHTRTTDTAFFFRLFFVTGRLIILTGELRLGQRAGRLLRLACVDAGGTQLLALLVPEYKY